MGKAQLISGPHETGNPTVRAADGPFKVSWSGGMPDDKNAGTTRWLTVTGPKGGPETGMFLRVPATEKARELVLQVGAQGAEATVRAELDGKQKQVSHRLAASDKGYVVTIRFRTGSSSGNLTVELAAGDGGTVALAAAALR